MGRKFNIKGKIKRQLKREAVKFQIRQQEARFASADRHLFDSRKKIKQSRTSEERKILKKIINKNKNKFTREKKDLNRLFRKRRKLN